MNKRTLAKLRERDVRKRRRELQRKILVLNARRNLVVGSGIRQSYASMIAASEREIEKHVQRIREFKDRLAALPDDAETLRRIDRQIDASQAELELMTKIHQIKRIERDSGKRGLTREFLFGLADKVWEELRS